MTLLVEIFNGITNLMLIISTAFYFNHLVKTKKQRKLSTSENTMYIFILITFVFLIIGIFSVAIVE